MARLGLPAAGRRFLAGGWWLVAPDLVHVTSRSLKPWLVMAGGVLMLGYGIREWARNGSPTVRRLKPAAEVAQDAERAQRMRRWTPLRIGLAVAAVAAGLLVGFLQR